MNGDSDIRVPEASTSCLSDLCEKLWVTMNTKCGASVFRVSSKGVCALKLFIENPILLVTEYEVKCTTDVGAVGDFVKSVQGRQ